MSQKEEAKAELVIIGDDWERFLSTLEKFMTLHHKTIQRLNDFRHRNEALREELRDAINLSKVKVEPVKEEPVQPTQPRVETDIDHEHFEVHRNQPVERLKYAAEKPARAGLGVLGWVSRGVRSRSRASEARNFAAPLASCGNCGFQINRASRFCESCGGDFGALTCPCGRELNPGDRFCDRCSRRV
jgi:hypothetical protein